MLTHQSFSGKIITVAGASRGIGLATVKYLLARGATVSMSSSSDENLAKAVQELKEQFPDIDIEDCLMSQVCDITKLEMVEEWIRTTKARFGKIDGCANVSGK
jgi:NAD(P)-dependent dehydrogenase (short-subunit alcohol dehydrogenase family)